MIISFYGWLREPLSEHTDHSAQSQIFISAEHIRSVYRAEGMSAVVIECTPGELAVYQTTMKEAKNIAEQWAGYTKWKESYGR